MSALRPLSLCAALALCSAATAGPGLWTTNGPHGGSVISVAADPLSVDRLVAIGRGGVFLTVDGGLSWQRHETGAFVFVPSALDVGGNASVFYMASNGDDIYRWDGTTPGWAPTAFAPASATFIHDLDIDPTNADRVGVLGYNGVWFTSDGGASWSAPTSGLPPPSLSQRPLALAYHGLRQYIGYSEEAAAGEFPVFVSTDGGVTWNWTGGSSPPGFFGAFGDGDLAVAPTDANRVYYVDGGSVHYSTDGGANWATLPSPPATTGGPLSVTPHPTDSDQLYVGFQTGFHHFEFPSTWTALDAGLSADGLRTNRVLDAALAPGFPIDDRIWLASDPGGLWRSDDAGTSWVTSHDFIESANIRALAVNPLDHMRLWAGYGDGFGANAMLYRSTDSALNWSQSNAGMTAVTIRGITVDPTTAAVAGSEHVFAVGSSADDDGPDDAGVYKSTDGGTTWTVLAGGLDSGPPLFAPYIGTQRVLALDPRSCASPPPSGPCTSGPLQTAYLAGSGRVNALTGTYSAARIHKSIDAGATWSDSETGLPGPMGTPPCRTMQAAIPLAIDPVTPTTLYVGLFISSQNDETSCGAPTIANGVFKSTDGGANWTHSSAGLPRWDGVATSSHYDVLALAIDPSTPTTLYAAVGKALTDGRVFKSADSGATWTEISVGIAGQDVRALLVDPTTTSTVYAASGGNAANPGGVYRSDDGGLTWNSISIGLPADAATALVLDPTDATRLIAGTTSSVWELTQVPDGDMDGAPTATEDAAPNGGDGDASGTADSEESDVASFDGAGGTPAAAHAAHAKGMFSYITIDVSPIAGNCARVNNAHALAASSLPRDDGHGGPTTTFGSWGVFRFELPDCTEAQLDVTVHGADFGDVDWTWRNFGPSTPGDPATLDWYGYGDAVKLDADTWRVTVRAGETGSYRDDASNILFVGAPGLVDVHIFGQGFED